jgi:three-Cys-motif partner protein
MADVVGGLDDDGMYTPTIKTHSVEKVRLHNYYVSIFTTAMRKHWPQLAYLGLYSGPGRAKLERTGEILETSALGALRVTHPFTKYIFVDDDPRCTEALDRRVAALRGHYDVTIIQKDVSEAVPDVVDAMPQFSRDRGLLSFCFIDPFSAALDFRIIKELGSRYKMDFLILLMLGRDIRTNFRRYFDDPADSRIGALVDDPTWREEWRNRRLQPDDLIPFVYEKFDLAMTRIGYEAARKEDAYSVRIPGKNVFLYGLALYGRDPLANRLWKAARLGVDPQYGFGL